MERSGKTTGPEPSYEEIEVSGEVDPVSGLSRFVKRPEAAVKASSGKEGYRWRDILEKWKLIEADMQDIYHIDLSEPGLLTQRSARWLKVRILGLAGNSRSRLSVMASKEE